MMSTIWAKWPLLYIKKCHCRLNFVTDFYNFDTKLLDRINGSDESWFYLYGDVPECCLGRKDDRLNYLVSTLEGLVLVWFYSISTIIGYLMPNPLYTYILDLYNLVWLGFMAYQPL